MGKPVPKRIDSGDCAVSSNGETYYPHEGEWVDMFTGVAVGAFVELTQWQRLGVELQAAQDDPQAANRIGEVLETRFDDLYKWIAERIVGWNWTDNRGQPYDNPYDNPGVLKKLSMEELMYLLQAGQGETPKQRKNASRPSRITSSAIGSQPTPKT